MIVIDTDNAMGSPFGDIDDAFAITALVKSKTPILCINSVFGNTFEKWSYQNTKTLASLLKYDGKILRGSKSKYSRKNQAIDFLIEQEKPITILALGPLTNIARALEASPALAEKIKNIIVVATNFHLRMPAFRLSDFNQSRDRQAFRAIVNSQIPLTVLPCDIAKSLQVSFSDIKMIPDDLGKYLTRASRRWFVRAKVMKFSNTIPIWDLGAALYAINPSLFHAFDTTLILGKLGDADYKQSGGRPVRVIGSFSREKVWDYFLSLVRQY